LFYSQLAFTNVPLGLLFVFVFNRFDLQVADVRLPIGWLITWFAIIWICWPALLALILGTSLVRRSGFVLLASLDIASFLHIKSVLQSGVKIILLNLKSIFIAEFANQHHPSL